MQAPHKWARGGRAAAPAARDERIVLSEWRHLLTVADSEAAKYICEPSFKVKDFFEFVDRLLMGDGVVRSEPANTFQLPLPALKFTSGQLRPEHLAHVFVNLFVA